MTRHQQIKVLKDILEECELKKYEKIADPEREIKMKHRKRVIESLIEDLKQKKQQDGLFQ